MLTKIDGVAGVITRPFGVGAVTVSWTLSVRPASVAVTVTVPAARPVASPRPPPPRPPPLVMLAMAPSEVVQVAVLVTTVEVPSLQVSLAWNWIVPLTTMAAVPGEVICRPTGVAASFTVSDAESVNPL